MTTTLLDDSRMLEPCGVLAIHFKEIKNFRVSHFLRNTETDNEPWDLFIAVRVGKRVVEQTNMFQLIENGSLILDTLRHIPIRVQSNNRFDTENTIRIELVHYESDGNHLTLGFSDSSLFTIIKSLFLESAKLEFRNGEYTLGEVQVDLLFAYGAFGYGYSNQILDRLMPVQNFTNHCIFVRLEPPSKRKDKFGLDVMTALKISYPFYLPTTVRKEFEEIDSGALQFQGEMPRHVAPLLTTISQTLEVYTKLTTRRSRLDFLENLVTNSGSYANNYALVSELKEQGTQGQSKKADAKADARADAMGEITHLLEMEEEDNVIKTRDIEPRKNAFRGLAKVVLWLSGTLTKQQEREQVTHSADMEEEEEESDERSPEAAEPEPHHTNILSRLAASLMGSGSSPAKKKTRTTQSDNDSDESQQPSTSRRSHH